MIAPGTMTALRITAWYSLLPGHRILFWDRILKGYFDTPFLSGYVNRNPKKWQWLQRAQVCCTLSMDDVVG